MSGNPEVECRECNGEGVAEIVSGYARPCDACHGEGWREMTDDERDDASANAFSDMCENEPPVTLDEQHQRAWQQKQGLRS